jgi:enoyl-CoA hydratase/carnithine racemase
MDTGTQRLLGEKDGAIGWMIFNHPERRNALSVDMWQAIPRVLGAFEADPEVRVIVFKGAGDKAFVSGADISQFGEHRAGEEASAVYNAGIVAATQALNGLAKPSIAMIGGFCIGGGLAVALTCDIRICSDDSRFGIPAARLGVGYGFDGMRDLIDVVGPAYAKEILFTARQFDAAEALRIGLVNKVVTRALLEETVRGYTDQIAQNAPLTIKTAKLAVREALKDPDQRQLGQVQDAVDACFRSADYAEGRNAFMEKRKPQFRGA